ncbi:MAG TPA: hypothetical protein IAD46_04730 [Candidatus Pelethenecus faecipullorum]|uniref:Uncharacterized protein n=1 Tax=Candidatus Pelethenecus faecipullorum TaxID=2840900 RepID=A0A9D1KJB7_9MOLU|nr:hypothetical protein [Candidatus Pelethenecus faecipullorum]
MEKLVLENEKQIEQFDIKYYIEHKKFPIASALCALEATNEIQKAYFEKEFPFDQVSEKILRLYALLQGLFVSIDSLYALAYSLTKSKNFININSNKELRELKYIRNDVVGHPANRTYSSDTLAYCILDTRSIQQKEFSYFIYSADEVSVKKVDLEALVHSYYEECNRYLKQIYQIAIDHQKQSGLLELAENVLDSYQNKGDYPSKLNELKEAYQTQYPQADPSLHRVLWRMDLILKLQQFHHADPDVMDLACYSIGLEIVKIYELIALKPYSVAMRKKTPYLVASIYRFLNKNPSLQLYTDKLYDCSNPLFQASLNHLLKVATKKKVQGVVRYLNLLKELAHQKQPDLVYALALPIKQYQKK